MQYGLGWLKIVCDCITSKCSNQQSKIFDYSSAWKFQKCLFTIKKGLRTASPTIISGRLRIPRVQIQQNAFRKQIILVRELEIPARLIFCIICQVLNLQHSHTKSKMIFYGFFFHAPCENYATLLRCSIMESTITELVVPWNSDKFSRLRIVLRFEKFDMVCKNAM